MARFFSLSTFRLIFACHKLREIPNPCHIVIHFGSLAAQERVEIKQFSLTAKFELNTARNFTNCAIQRNLY